MADKKCPNCTETELRRADRHGVEIDYCPDCNGIWLDCGELRKIVDASLQAASECCASAKPDRQSKLKGLLGGIFGTRKYDEDESERDTDPLADSGDSSDAGIEDFSTADMEDSSGGSDSDCGSCGDDA